MSELPASGVIAEYGEDGQFIVTLSLIAKGEGLSQVQHSETIPFDEVPPLSWEIRPS
jgi:hypothetical protein